MAYFLRVKSKVFGPFDESQLLEMKSKGKITRSTEISEDKRHWQEAESFRFLFGLAAASAQSTNSWQPLEDEPADWFYSVNGTEGYGPVTTTAIEQMLRSGQLSGNSYVWQEGQNARFIKNESQFSSPGSGSTKPAPVENTGSMANIGGEITGISEQVDTGQMLRPIAASLGWLMFLKITFLLVGIIVQGLSILLGGSFWISHSLGKDDATVLLVTLMTLVLWAGFYALLFKTFLCFWKYHTVLNQTVATGRASDLIQANQCQSLFWKWLSITAIAWLSIYLTGAVAIMIATGLESGRLVYLFQKFF